MMNNKITRIVCGTMCFAMLLPMLAGCKDKGDNGSTESAASLPPVISMTSEAVVPETNDVPAKESPLAKEEFVLGNVFFNKAVTSIELSDCIIDSLDPLIECPYLDTLSLSGCKVLSWTALNSLTQVQNLTISDCGFDNLSNLSDLTQLKTLDISNNDISDIIKLSSLKNLTSLMVTGGDVKSIGSVKYMPKLQVLKIDGKSCDDLSPLAEKSDGHQES